MQGLAPKHQDTNAGSSPLLNVPFSPLSIPGELASLFYSFFDMSPALEDIVTSCKQLSTVFYFAWSETKARYKRSVLGPLWLTLGTAIGVAGLGVVWSILLKTDMRTFVPPLTVGLILWQFISGCITESPVLFVRQSGVIRNLHLPYFFHPLQLLMRHLITLLHNSIVILVVFLVFPPQLTPAMLMALPGLVLLVLNMLWLILLIGMLGARFRDIEPLVQAFMPMVFFVTPVLYRAENLGFRQYIMWLNPLAHLIGIVRDPLMGVMPGLLNYAVSVAIAIVGWGLTFYLFKSRRNRIPYWV